MTPCFWIMLCTCIVLLPILAYLIFRLTIKTMRISTIRYASLIKQYTESLPPLEKSPIPCKVFYINLDRSVKRKEHFETQAKQLMLKYERIPAVNGRNMLSVSKGFIDGLLYKSDFHNLSIPELACTLSHLKAIRTAYNQKLNFAMICEDDISFELHRLWPDNLIPYLLKKLDPSIGILQLQWNSSNVKKTNTSCGYEQSYILRPYQKGGNCWGTGAYIITRKGMQDVLDHSSYLGGHSIHIKKDIKTSFGAADGYIYQSTLVANCGYPILIPAQENIAATTIQNNDIGGLVVRNRILQGFIQKNKVVKKTIGKKPQLAQYRLSDAIFGNHRPIWTKKYHMKWYPNSLVGQYFQRTNQFGNKRVLKSIILKNKHSLKQQPPNDGIVIHLRLGDAIEKCKYSVDEHLSKELPFTFQQYNSAIWVHSTSYYDNKLKNFPNFNKIVLVYGQHGLTQTFPKTEEYVTKLKQHFENRGYQVSIHYSNFDPDQDFLYMCFAPHLIAGGGSGYANIALEMNHQLRNK